MGSAARIHFAAQGVVSWRRAAGQAWRAGRRRWRATKEKVAQQEDPIGEVDPTISIRISRVVAAGHGPTGEQEVEYEQSILSLIHI